jgi:hypothetical protein
MSVSARRLLLLAVIAVALLVSLLHAATTSPRDAPLAMRSPAARR